MRVAPWGASSVSFLGVVTWLAAVAGAQDLPPLSSPAQSIDQFIANRWVAEGITPAPMADDAVLIRRLMLDLVGRPATPKEIESFVNQISSGTDFRVVRQQFIESLMASPEFIEHQVVEFDSLLMGANRESLKSYLDVALRENRAWDVMFRDLMMGDQPETATFLKSRVKDLDKLTNEASVLFFGVNISCAKCHDHPLVPEWTQDRFFGMKSFFNRTFEHGDWVGEHDYGGVDFKTTDGESKKASLMFFTGKVVDEPEWKAPDDAAKKKEKSVLEELKKKKEPAPAPKFSRRQALVDVALEPENEFYFAKAIVNRLWKRFYGRGLVDPIDQMHPECEPSHPQLLNWLAQDLIDHQYNLRRLIEAMVSSDTYGRSSRWPDNSTRPQPSAFAVAEVRPLTPRQYAFTLRLGSTSPEHFAVDADEHQQRLDRLRKSANSLASSFEAPGEHFQISVTEALLMSNSDRIENDLLRDNNESLVSYLGSLESNEQRAMAALSQVFGHPPQASQVQAVTDYLDQRADRQQESIQQVVWALLCSSACRFNY